MRKSKKTALIIAVVLIAAGFAASLAALAMLEFDFTRMNTISFVTNTYSIDEAISCISISGAECDVRLLPANDGASKVVCYESDKISHCVTVKDSTLMIERRDAREWYEHIGAYWGAMEIAIYLPQSEYETLYIKNLSGDIVIPEDFTFESADIQSTSGDVDFRASVSGDLAVKTVSGDLLVGKTNPDKLTAQSTSGDMTVESVNVQTKIEMKTVSGDIDLSNVRSQCITADTTSGEVDFDHVITVGSIHIESVSGDVELNKCDADTLWLKTSSGDVSGFLLTEKIFLTDTSSGDVNVPHSASGGKCEITTTSGNIKFVSN